MAYVLLVNPNKVEYPSEGGDISGEEISPPLGLMLLAAVLRDKGHEVRIFDRQTTEGKRQLSRELGEYAEALQEMAELDFVGITCITLFRHDARDFIAKTREVKPHVKVVVGGPDATFAYDEYLTHGYADFVVLGEGELTLSALVDEAEPSSVPGIAYRAEDQIIKTGTPDMVDLEQLPFPARDLVELDKYPKDATSMVSSRGCPYHCIFCSSREFWGPKFRTVTAEKMANEIELLYTRYGYTLIRHHDDNWANRSEDFLTDLRGELAKKGLADKVKHEVETSPVTINSTKLKLMKQIGVNTVWISMETAQPHLLQYLRKPYRLKDVEKAARLLKREGIDFGLYLIFGLPDETYEQAVATIDKACDLQPAYVGISVLTGYPGTQLFRETPPGDNLGNLLFDLIGWGHWGKYLGRKMTVHQLLKVFAYAHRRFGSRAGNSWRLRQMFQFNQEQELIEVIEDADQPSGRRFDYLLRLREKMESEPDEGKSAALEVVYEYLLKTYSQEDSRFGARVRDLLREPPPPPRPPRRTPEQACRKLVGRIGRIDYFASVIPKLNALRDALDDEGDQMEIFREVIEKLWPDNMGRDAVMNLFDNACATEHLLRWLGLRKHFLHQFRVFLLGSYIIAELQDSMSQSTEAKQLGLTSMSLYNTWLMASGFHDIGLIAERCPEMNQKLASMFECLGLDEAAKAYKTKEGSEDLLRAQIKTQNGGMGTIDLMSVLQAWLSETGILTEGIIGREGGREIHGILGALIMLRTLEPFLGTTPEPATKASILTGEKNRDVGNALAAIAVHSLRTDSFSEQLTFKNHPVPFLLRLTDELDEEKRMTEDAEDKPELRLVDINVQVKNSEKTIELVFKPSASGGNDISKSKKSIEEEARNYYTGQKKWFKLGSITESELSDCNHSVEVVAILDIGDPLTMVRQTIIER